MLVVLSREFVANACFYYERVVFVWSDTTGVAVRVVQAGQRNNFVFKESKAMSSRYGFNSANGSLDASFRDIELQPIFLTIEDDDDYGNYTAVTQIGFAHTPSVPAAPVQSLRGSPLLPPVQILPAFPIRTISPDPEVMQFDVDVSGISSKPSVVTESKQRLLPKDDPKADLSARLKALNAKFPKFSIGQLKTFYEQFQFFDEVNGVSRMLY